VSGYDATTIKHGVHRNTGVCIAGAQSFSSNILQLCSLK
jgi:hypothetical protein